MTDNNVVDVANVSEMFFEDSLNEDIRYFISECFSKIRERCIYHGCLYSKVDIFPDDCKLKFVVHDFTPAIVNKVYVNNVHICGDIYDRDLEDFVDLKIGGMAATKENVEYLINDISEYLEDNHVAVEYVAHYFVLKDELKRKVDIVINFNVLKRVSSDFLVKVHGLSPFDEIVADYFKRFYGAERSCFYNFLRDLNVLFPGMKYAVNIHAYVSEFKKENHFIMDFFAKRSLATYSRAQRPIPILQTAVDFSDSPDLVSYGMFTEHQMSFSYLDFVTLKMKAFSLNDEHVGLNSKSVYDFLLNVKYPIKSLDWNIGGSFYYASMGTVAANQYPNLLRPAFYLKMQKNIQSIGSIAISYFGITFSSYTDKMSEFFKNSYLYFFCSGMFYRKNLCFGCNINSRLDEQNKIVPLDRYVTNNKQLVFRLHNEDISQHLTFKYSIYNNNFEVAKSNLTMSGSVGVFEMQLQYKRFGVHATFSDRTDDNFRFAEEQSCRFNFDVLKINTGYLKLDVGISISTVDKNLIGMSFGVDMAY